jgi:hypothetical protein
VTLFLTVFKILIPCFRAKFTINVFPLVRQTGSSQPCLNVRKKLASCYKQNQGEPSNCDALVNELGACIELGVERINAQGRPVEVLSDS